MQVTITINCDNAAFTTDATGEISGTEVVNVLNRLSQKINYAELKAGNNFNANDSNGNKVAVLEVTE